MPDEAIAVPPVSPVANPADPFAVPDEPGVWWCHRHRKVQTRLRCGRCELPICPKCTIIGPAGARCPDCASNRSSHMYQVNALHLLMAFGAALVMGAAGGLLVSGTGLGILIVLYGPAAGTLIGQGINKVVRGKRGPLLAGVTGLGTVCGTVQACNCSICTMTGFQHLIVAKDRFRLQTSWHNIAAYTFNTGVARHLFCKRCGIKSFYIPRSNPDGYSVNLRCIDEGTMTSAIIEPFDGRAWEAHGGDLAHLSKA